MKPDQESVELYALVEEICDSHSDRPSIHPAWLATEAMIAIEFPRDLNPRGYVAAHLQFRQIARSFCRKHFDPSESVQSELFQDTLQQRYPRPSTGDEPEYILLDLMEWRDIRFNVDRLRKEAAAKMKHADALEAWARRKFGRVA